jgi:hypothetical protein
MDLLTAFGLFAVTAMLVTSALEDSSPWYILAFAGACLLRSAYGFLQGAWPFGVLEAVWAGVAASRWALQGLSRGQTGLNQSAMPMLQCDGLERPDFIG